MRRRAFWDEIWADPVGTIRLHALAIQRLWKAKIGLQQRGWQRSLENNMEFSEGGSIDEAELRRLEIALHRASRLMPDATCIHRALAAKEILDEAKISSRIVIGLRKGSDTIEGHAWIEVKSARSSYVAFVTDESGYKEIEDLRRAKSLLGTKRESEP